MIAFHALFPEIAEVETRHVSVPAGQGLPAGTYVFQESYCIERKCDCHRVILSVVEVGAREQVATINHSLRPQGGREFAEDGTFLDPLNPQSEHSRGILRLFHELVCDAVYEERLRRHYRIVKDAIRDSAHPVNARLEALGVTLKDRAPVRVENRVGRNEPCPCGSGKKAKKCCGPLATAPT